LSNEFKPGFVYRFALARQPDTEQFYMLIRRRLLMLLSRGCGVEDNKCMK